MIEVWCDVGGTFTDCYVVKPGGGWLRTKVLSHGRVLSFVRCRQGEFVWRDSSRCGDPDRFWEGCLGVAMDRTFNQLGKVRCEGFEGKSGCFRISGVEGELDWDAIDLVEWDPQVEAPILATRLLLGIGLQDRLPALQVRLGTTKATNALLTRRGEPTALLVTAGFEDLLTIGYQDRPELFVTRIVKRPSLVDVVVGVRERLDASGRVLISIDDEQVRGVLQGIAERGIRSIAICLLHSTCNPTHELRVEAIAREMGFDFVRCSHQVAPVIQAVARGETTVVDAYLTPVVRDYLEMVSEQFSQDADSRLRVMTSGGGLVSAAEVWGRHLVLSGPAGGAVALQAMSHRFGLKKLIGLDMGGTSTDVCRIEGRLQLEHETVKAGIRMMVPTLAIHTVAAGGGSVCYYDGVQLRVGPQSAGSIPGPACYGKGGPLTVTDLNLLEGRIDPVGFPFPLDVEASKLRLRELWDHLSETVTGREGDGESLLTQEQLVSGLRCLANEQMASAVRSISIEQGADPREHVLAGFGGAAGQHLCEVAELLGIDTVVDHPEAGLLSALGIGLAQIKRSKSEAIYILLGNLDFDSVNFIRRRLFDQLTRELVLEGVDEANQEVYCEVELRVKGTEGAIRVEWKVSELELTQRVVDGWVTEFERRYREKFGVEGLSRGRGQRAIELVSIWMEVSSAMRELGSVSQYGRVDGEALMGGENGVGDKSRVVEEEVRLITLMDQGHWVKAKSIDRAVLKMGDRLVGPVLIRSVGSTTILNGGWQGEVVEDGVLLMSRLKGDSDGVRNGETESREADLGVIDPILRDVLAQRVGAIAEQMGIVLEQTALSVNVKQRRDFSCAVFNARGELIANAPHVPVHLGAMGRTVQAMIEVFPEMRPGDCYVTNDPYRGGSHLPDVTVVTPVFIERGNESIGKRGGDKPDFFVASRAHHAEIGGVAPGSMAPTSKRLGEEGVILSPMHLTFRGEDLSDQVEARLRGGEYPSRSVGENMADLWAQRAANQRGMLAMQDLASAMGVGELHRYFDAILRVAEVKTRAWIGSLAKDEYFFRDSMDDGSVIQVRVIRKRREEGWSLSIDFEGSGSESIGNLNANPGIVTAAVMYTIRCAIADTLPLNYGVMRAVELRIPPGILDPRGSGPLEQWPAVAGGNVETSQRVVDVLWGALGLAAASQGTMNNFLFGNDRFGYYETIGGGSGASEGGAGADAVHSHMTNTRLTDVEVLESRYPVRLVEFGIRRGSGGAGRHTGGCGMVREIEALERLEVSLVTNRRTRVPGGFGGPFGLFGGENGQPGENWWIDRDGVAHRLPSACQRILGVGERIRLLTPGGGGWGNRIVE